VKRHRPTDLPDRSRSPRPFGRLAGFAALATLFAGTSGCGALLLVGGAGTSAIAFATGELRSTEKTALAELDAACASAVDAERTADQIRWRARTASGDPVDIRLMARKSDRTELRIRIGVFGDEAKSRLVLEQIHQAL
jgi:hypothetical protein